MPDISKFDLRDYKSCIKAFKGADIVIHLAGNVGGIGYNQNKPAELFDDNLLMGVNAIRAARIVGIKNLLRWVQFVLIQNILQFHLKKMISGMDILKKQTLHMDLLKMLLVQSQAYRQQYGFNSIYLLPVNLYGPGDNFNPKSSHVIPALIKKFVEAKITILNKQLFGDQENQLVNFFMWKMPLLELYLLLKNMINQIQLI